MRSGLWIWLWLFFLILINVVPIGNSANTRINIPGKGSSFTMRIDYLMHAVSFLVFAWIEILTMILKHKSFGSMKFLIVVFLAAVGVELLQSIFPWRRFNIIDMIYNLFGAVVAVILVILGQKKQIKSN